MSIPPKLLDDAALESSSVVAHRFMNRERELRGGNGYAREIGFDAFDFLAERASDRPHARWLDLCCGSGRALIDAARLATEHGLDERITIRGIDLVGHFARAPRELACLELATASLHRFDTSERYDLITCVHGLHYVGDKLGLLARACRWLAEDGVLSRRSTSARCASQIGPIRRDEWRMLSARAASTSTRAATACAAPVRAR
jgi:SAM-dependent methyltransferase